MEHRHGQMTIILQNYAADFSYFHFFDERINFGDERIKIGDERKKWGLDCRL